MNGIRLCCLDLEGVLIPEIWIGVAKQFQVDELKLTTRDISDYDLLMKRRIEILRARDICLKDIQNVIGKLKPLPGAKEFLKKLRERFPVIILSDTYYEFAGPFMRQLGNPVLFCNSLKIDRRGFLAGYTLRQKDGKKRAVQLLRQLGFSVSVAGDSFNDLSMLLAADRKTFFNPPKSIQKKYPNLPVARNYSALLRFFCS